MNALDFLVGAWELSGENPVQTAKPPRGEVSFEWLTPGSFLVERWTIDLPEFPDGIAILGPNPDTGGLAQFYFDSRGVARVYDMTVAEGVWTLSRQGAPFDQRYVGQVSDDGNTISGAWERSDDGTTWEHDFNLTYTRRG